MGTEPIAILQLVKCAEVHLTLATKVCGLTTRQHGNHNRVPHNSLSFVETKNVIRFLSAYAEAHVILLPGRIPGYKRDDLQLFPSSTTKKVYKFLYTSSLVHILHLTVGSMGPVQVSM